MIKKVSLFIPVYNCQHLVRANIEKSLSALSNANLNFELFIVDDNSTDRSHTLSAEIELLSRSGGYAIHFLHYSLGPSRRENLAKSFYLAEGDIICFIDADFSCDISYLIKAIRMIEGSAFDIVIGSRYVKGAKAKRRPVRKIFSLVYNLTLRKLFGSRIKDHQCGLKVFKKSSVMPIIKKMGYDEKFIRGWFWDGELLIRAQKQGLSILEMPVEWSYADKSTFSLQRELRGLKAILKLKKELG